MNKTIIEYSKMYYKYIEENIVPHEDQSLQIKYLKGEVGYDENGILCNMVFDSPDRGERTFVIKDLILDDMGNPISSVTYRNGELFSINEINIEYY